MLKFLSTIWLIMALATVPVQALNASPGQAASGPCKMHIDSPDASGANCPFCADRSCSTDSCPGSSCATLHIQPAMFLTLHFVSTTDAEIPGLAPVFATGSGTSPPPLPPPV